MRRSTRGVIRREDLVPKRIARLERRDPERVIQLLEPLALERRRERLMEVIERRLESVTVIFDAPHDPHNGAAVLRTCEAFGIQTLHVVERREPFLAAGSVARSAEKWVDVEAHVDAESAIAAVRAKGMLLVGAHPDGELLPADLADIPRFALVLGNERDGITEELAQACDRRVRVPMRGFVESLNVSVTAAILLSHMGSRSGDLSPSERRRLYARGLYFSVQKSDSVLTLSMPGDGTGESRS